MDFKKFWKSYGLLVLVLVFIVVVSIAAFVYRNDKGTVSKFVITYEDIPKTTRKTRTSSDREPKDSKLETATRRSLEDLLGKPFPKIRPNFLNNPVTGGTQNLELDCYNDDLKLGVEIQGIQHYKYVPFFHKNKEAFMNQKYRDELKRRMCKDEGISLIEVPYTVKEKDVEKFLSKELRKLGYL